MTVRNENSAEEWSDHWASAGLLVYRATEEGVVWLLIDSKFSRARPAWQFPKGRIERGELPRQAAVRECREETGVEIDPEALNPAFHERLEWIIRHRGRRIRRTVDFFLATTEQVKTQPDWEVCEARWFRTEQALDMLQHEDARTLLSRAVERLAETPQPERSP